MYYILSHHVSHLKNIIKSYKFGGGKKTLTISFDLNRRKYAIRFKFRKILSWHVSITSLKLQNKSYKFLEK